ncbi:MAG: MBL fold metallo-hydrolase [Streptosporangiales bacterium]
MLIEAFPAQALDTNCYVVARAAGSECVIVDPGLGVAPRLDAIVARHDLRPVAVLVSHGHIDHTFSVTELCEAYGVPVYVHRDDEHLLERPEDGLTPDLLTMLGDLQWKPPADVRGLTAGEVELAGLSVGVDHAPGHTPGSVLYRLTDEPVCLSGDVLFAGSIGRTDLPGGDHAAMLRTLSNAVLAQPDDTVVLPGHGPRTTIGGERRANPFLHDLA